MKDYKRNRRFEEVEKMALSTNEYHCFGSCAGCSRNDSCYSFLYAKIFQRAGYHNAVDVINSFKRRLLAKLADLRKEGFYVSDQELNLVESTAEELLLVLTRQEQQDLVSRE